MAKPNFTLPNKPAIKSGSILSYNYTDDFTFVPAPLTFNRDSAATRVNEKGLIEDVGYFGPELVQNGNFSEIGSELVTNGDFETDSDWSNFGTPTTSEQSTDIAYLGSYSWYVVASAFRQGIFSPNNFSLVSGKTYRASLWIYALDGAEILSGVTNSDASVFTSRTVAQGQWTNVVYYFTANASSASYISILSSSSTLEFYVDNVSVKEVGQNWTFTDVDLIEQSGNLKSEFNTHNGTLLQSSLGLTPSNKYRISLDANIVSNSSFRFYLGTHSSSDTESIYDVSVSGNSVFDLESGSTDIIKIVQTNPTTGNTIDNISVIEVLGDKPRIDYSDSLTEPSLLLEPQSTNLVTYSEDFSANGGWNFNNTSSEINSAVSPSGLLNAYKIIANNNSAEHNVRRNVALPPANTNETVSVFAKQAGFRYFFYRLNLSGVWYNTIFDLENGVITLNESGSECSIISYGNGWYRCILNSTNRTNFLVQLGVSNVPNSHLSQGDGVSGVYLWGAQLEEQSYATSYIPTAGSTATRLGETANNAGDVNVFNSEEGVLYAEFATISKNYNFPTIRLYDGTNNNAVRIFPVGLGGNNIQAQVDSGGSISFVSVSTNNDPTQYNKIAVKYQKDNFSFYINGTQHATDNSGNTPVGLNKFEFQSNLFYGKVRNVKVFNKALTDRELEILTIQ